MEAEQFGTKLTQLQKFLTDPDSEESRNYISDILSGETNRPEDLFVQKFLSVDFWKELGFKDSEIKIEYPAGTTGRVEITLKVDEHKIAIECKKPYFIRSDKVSKNVLNGEDINELKNQIGEYLLSHSFIIFTNGFHWYFYSRQSYVSWLGSRNKQTKLKLKPYFEYLESDILFNKDSPNFILNILTRKNILNTLSGIEYESIRHVLTDEFFKDLKSWIKTVDQILKKAPINLRARTTTLINKLIFVRTMEDVGIIPNRFLSTLWESKKGVRNSSVNFLDNIDDELSEIYDTELFTPKYVTNAEGQLALKDGIPEYSEQRKKNFAYSSLPDSFMSAILRIVNPEDLNDKGISQIVIDQKIYYLRSLYWWRFESIPGDILGKAYETYLARERKKLGIYYTPHQITEYLTKKTVDTVFDEKISELTVEVGKESWNSESITSIAESIKKIRICDPSCGSGSFLIQAIRIILNKYNFLENLISELNKKYREGRATLDEHFTEKVGIIRYLTLTFRVNDKQQRMGVMILRHIFGNDKDIKAVDTAKLNIWLECIRLDPNSYRKENLAKKVHVLPNLELNITNGDSLIGLGITETSEVLSNVEIGLDKIMDMKKKYVESFENTQLAPEVIDIKKEIQEEANQVFSEGSEKENAKKLLEFLKPTHWLLQVPEAFYDQSQNLKPEEDRGFDAIIGNPPWEILKPNINEFFGPLYDSEDLKRFSLLSKKEKDSIQQRLLKDPYVEADWKRYKDRILIQQIYFHKTNEFKNQMAVIGGRKFASDINLYKLFLERYFSLLKKGGLCGVVLPSGFYSELASRGLRELLFSNTEISELISFENRRGIFEDLHRQAKFILLIFRKSVDTKKFKTAFYVQDLKYLSNPLDMIEYDINWVKDTSPNALSLLEYRTKEEIDILKKLFAFPLLLESSKWLIEFTNEFHMTKHSNLFNDERNGIPLLEGKMIYQFRKDYSSPRYWIDKELGLNELASKEKKRLKVKLKELKKFDEIDDYRYKLDCEYYRIGWRDVTNATNERGMIATIIPPMNFLGNTINYIRPIYFNGERYQYSLTPKQSLFLCGLLNSFVVDFILRHKISSHANMFYVAELPIPRYQEGDQYFSEICQRVASLLCVNDEFLELKKECGIQDSEINDDSVVIMAQIDAYVAKVYKLTKDEFQYILNTFPIVNEKIKNKTLEEFDSI